MQRVDHQADGTRSVRFADSPALGLLMALPVAALLWLAIIATAFELFKWATTP